MADTRPNDLPGMMLGEKRLVEFTWAGGAGLATLNSVDFTCSPTGGATFSAVDPDGVTATPIVTAEKTGRYKLIADGTLSSGEQIKLTAYVNITDPTQDCTDRDYR